MPAFAIPAPRGVQKERGALVAPRSSQQKSRPPAPHSARKEKTLSQKELSVVVMLLAAETAVCSAMGGTPGDGYGREQASLPGWASRLRASSHFPKGVVALEKTAIDVARAAFQADPPKPIAGEKECQQEGKPVAYDGLNEAVRRVVCSFLPWRDCTAVRSVASTWKVASSETITISSLPSSTSAMRIPALFLPCPAPLDNDQELEHQLRCNHGFKWRCDMCGFLNTESRILCGNRGCQTPCPSHQGCARLFVGQLRREGTVPLLRWLVEDVVGHQEAPIRIRNVENHRDQQTGRGKGCAWIYIEDMAMAHQVLQFHHRVFGDMHPETRREGVWVVPRGFETHLAADVDRRAGGNVPRPPLLPRCPLVVELPALQQQFPPYSSRTYFHEPQAMSYHEYPCSEMTAPPSYAASSFTPLPADSSDSYAATDSPRSASEDGATSNEPRQSTPPTPAVSTTASVEGNATRKRRNEPYRTAPLAPSVPPMAYVPAYYASYDSMPGGFTNENGAYCSAADHYYPSSQQQFSRRKAW